MNAGIGASVPISIHFFENHIPGVIAQTTSRPRSTFEVVGTGSSMGHRRLR